VSAFKQLHPAVQYHIINSLGWSSLRPIQLEAIQPVLAGRNCLLLGAMAGGKTEAAVLPVLSRMLTESWGGLSVLYLCPSTTLLANLESRLAHYLGLVGRSAGAWHREVPASARRRVLADPPDLLLTTPESLDGMLVSRRVEAVPFLGRVRVVIVDELHALAADERGWHVRALLVRLQALRERACQIIGISAPVGNPDGLIQWLTLDGGSVCVGRISEAQEADVEIDHVGSTANAATVISRLHRGEKRLLFCDSPSRVAEIARALRRLGTRVFVSHSSQTPESRRHAEDALVQEHDCVIVTTSPVEIGVDLGELDRVIQIDAPCSVSSFLQRMGRTGRREGTQRNCLFLTTTPEALLVACAVTRLWREGYVEEVAPPAEPWDVVLQQLLALVLEHRALPRVELAFQVMQAFPELERNKLQDLLRHLETSDILSHREGLLHVGLKGERRFGRRHFSELTSVFLSSPDVTVLHGRSEIGYVAPAVLIPGPQDVPATLSLAGSSWRVRSVDWKRRRAGAEPVDSKSATRGARPLGYALCQAIRRVLAERYSGCTLSRGALECLDAERARYAFLGSPGRAVITEDTDATRLWTFAGLRCNLTLGLALGSQGLRSAEPGDFSLTLPPSSGEELRDKLERLPEFLKSSMAASVTDVPAATGIQFGDALPTVLRQAVTAQRLLDLTAAQTICTGALLPVRKADSVKSLTHEPERNPDSWLRFRPDP